MRTFIGLLLIVGLVCGVHVVPGHAQPTAEDLAWQAAGATAGMAAGTFVGAMASIPGFVQYGLMWEENQCAPTLSDATIQFDMEQPTDAACFGQFLSVIMIGTLPASAGTGLGTLAGLTVVAQGQGHTGSVVGAAMGVVAAQAAVVTWNMTTVPQFTNDLIEELERMNDPTESMPETTLSPDQWIQGTLLGLLVPVAAVLGYNFL